MSTVDAAEVASLCLHQGEKQLKNQTSQTQHRVDLVKSWGIPKGAKVLELGCGQGDCTAVLAETVGEEGKVTAVDPGSFDYGSPFTLGQAQAHLSSGPLGSRITWIQGDPLSFAAASDDTYDVAVLAHCLWYFASPELIANTLRVLSQKAKRVCIGEWSLTASDIAAVPHVLAVLTQASLECRKSMSMSNVRTVVSPASIKELASSVGLHLKHEQSFSPNSGMLDGKWEVAFVREASFVEEINEHVKDEREKGVVLALRDSLLAACEKAPDGIKSMNVWCGVFELAA